MRYLYWVGLGRAVGGDDIGEDLVGAVANDGCGGHGKRRGRRYKGSWNMCIHLGKRVRRRLLLFSWELMGRNKGKWKMCSLKEVSRFIVLNKWLKYTKKINI